MLTSRHQVTIEWGDCDPAGIVYFPNYFRYFDGSTNAHRGIPIYSTGGRRELP